MHFWFSGPKLFYTSFFHNTLTFRTSFPVSDSDIVTATVQAQTANLTPKGRCYICDDTTYYDILYRLAVRTVHRSNLLAE